MVSTPSTTPSLALALPLALALKRRPGDVINPCLWQTLLAQPSLALALDHSLTRSLALARILCPVVHSCYFQLMTDNGNCALKDDLSWKQRRPKDPKKASAVQIPRAKKAHSLALALSLSRSLALSHNPRSLSLSCSHTDNSAVVNLWWITTKRSCNYGVQDTGCLFPTLCTGCSTWL